MLIDCPSGNDL